MELKKLTQEEFKRTIQNDIGFLRVQDAYGIKVPDVDGVIGFYRGEAVVITDLDDKQKEFYAIYKR